jgi:two-component system sensor histidine kinase KdpD
LRELALEEIAQALDRRRRKRGADVPGTSSERVMVCLASRGPNVHRLLRKGARFADRLNAPWYAVYIQTPREKAERVDATTQRQIADSLTLAQQLGGVPMPYSGPDFATTVAAFVREYAITHIVMGRSRRPWYQRWFGQSFLDRLLRAVPGIDVLVVDTAP